MISYLIISALFISFTIWWFAFSTEIITIFGAFVSLLGCVVSITMCIMKLKEISREVI